MASLRHQQARREVERAAAADDDDPAARREQLGVVGQVDVGQHLDDDVRAAPARGRLDRVAIVRLRVIDGVMRAQLGDEREPPGAAGGGDHGEAGGARQLDGGGADRAAAAVHEDASLRRATPAFWKSARHAVEHGTPTAAPCAKESDGGSVWTLRASFTTSSA